MHVTTAPCMPSRPNDLSAALTVSFHPTTVLCICTFLPTMPTRPVTSYCLHHSSLGPGSCTYPSSSAPTCFPPTYLTNDKPLASYTPLQSLFVHASRFTSFSCHPIVFLSHAMPTCQWPSHINATSNSSFHIVLEPPSPWKCLEPHPTGVHVSHAQLHDGRTIIAPKSSRMGSPLAV